MIRVIMEWYKNSIAEKGLMIHHEQWILVRYTEKPQIQKDSTGINYIGTYFNN
jgi:hypothetical protein